MILPQKTPRELLESFVAGLLRVVQDAPHMDRERGLSPAIACGFLSGSRVARARRLEQNTRGGGVVVRIVSRRKTEVLAGPATSGVLIDECARHGLLRTPLFAQEASMTTNRREFIERLGATAMLGALPLTGISPKLDEFMQPPTSPAEDFDFSWFKRVQAYPHKACFDCAEVDSGYGVWRASMWEPQYHASLKVKPTETTTVREAVTELSVQVFVGPGNERLILS